MPDSLGMPLQLPNWDDDPTHTLASIGPLRFRRWSWLPGVSMAIVFSALAVVLFAAAAEASRSTAGAGSAAVITLSLLAVGSLVVALAAAAVSTTQVLFHEMGVARRSIFTSVVIRYEDVAAMVYRVEREFINGYYMGTSLLLRLQADDGRRITWRGPHRERRRGIWRPRYQGRDELDDVKALVSDHIADRMMEAILAGVEVPWTARARFNGEGLLLLRGRARGEVIDYADLALPEADGDAYLLFREGDSWPLLTLHSEDPNFWPGLRLLERMRAAATSREMARAA